MFRANLRDREREEPKAGPKQNSGTDLFDAYLSAKKECGEKVAGISRERLDGVIAKQRAAIREKYGCNDVKFRVVVEGGKTKLKATPVR